MTLATQVLQALAAERAREGRARRFLSGAKLAAELGVTRAAIWKAVTQLRDWDTPIEAVQRQGYRLVLPASPLDASTVIGALDPAIASRLRQGECAGSIESTNTSLLARGAPPPGQFDFLTAEHQRAGRGRRGRSWLATPGSAICLSWSWSFPALASQIGALSLAVGVAARRALARCGVEGVHLKWPNDLVTAHGKLGGILIEMRSEAAGPVHVVVGIGLNVALDAKAREHIDALGNSAADIASLGAPPARAALVAALLDEGVATMLLFERQGFAPFLASYAEADALRDLPVTLRGGNADPAQGIARGVCEDGALAVEHDGRMYRIIAGEVSVRRAQA